jgi:hypothetical protein
MPTPHYHNLRLGFDQDMDKHHSPYEALDHQQWLYHHPFRVDHYHSETMFQAHQPDYRNGILHVHNPINKKIKIHVSDFMVFMKIRMNRYWSNRGLYQCKLAYQLR